MVNVAYMAIRSIIFRQVEGDLVTPGANGLLIPNVDQSDQGQGERMAGSVKYPDRKKPEALSSGFLFKAPEQKSHFHYP